MMMSEAEAILIKQRCRSMGDVWNEMLVHHPKFATYIERLPDNFNSGEPLRCNVILQEVFEDIRQWAQKTIGDTSF